MRSALPPASEQVVEIVCHEPNPSCECVKDVSPFFCPHIARLASELARSDDPPSRWSRILSIDGSTCNGPSTLAEADGRESLPRALAAQGHFVAVGKELPCLTVGELDGPAAVGREFQQASLRLIAAAGNRARAQKISWA